MYLAGFAEQEIKKNRSSTNSIRNYKKHIFFRWSSHRTGCGGQKNITNLTSRHTQSDSPTVKIAGRSPLVWNAFFVPWDTKCLFNDLPKWQCSRCCPIWTCFLSFVCLCTECLLHDGLHFYCSNGSAHYCLIIIVIIRFPLLNYLAFIVVIKLLPIVSRHLKMWYSPNIWTHKYIIPNRVTVMPLLLSFN